MATVGVCLFLMVVWFVLALLFRLRFQFSIRTILVLTVAVALPFSWLGIEMKRAREQHDLVDEIQKVGGSVFYDWEQHATLPNAQPPGPGPGWLRTLLGEDFFGEVETVWYNGPDVTNVDLARLECLTQLLCLYLFNTQVTDAGLENVKGLTQVQELFLNDTQITDAGLENLNRLTQLQRLYLDGTKITDAGLESLARLARLQQLSLNNTEITDAGLEFAALVQLQYLSLNGTKVTSAGVKQLQRALPNCEIPPLAD